MLTPNARTYIQYQLYPNGLASAWANCVTAYNAVNQVALEVMRLATKKLVHFAVQYGYRMSKAAMNMAGATLAHELKPEKVCVPAGRKCWSAHRLAALPMMQSPVHACPAIEALVRHFSRSNSRALRM